MMGIRTLQALDQFTSDDDDFLGQLVEETFSDGSRGHEIQIKTPGGIITLQCVTLPDAEALFECLRDGVCDYSFEKREWRK